jgi:hypothetical protein
MMRQFQFEADIYKSLNCLPLAARRKLDRLGIKISLEQWQRFSRAERLMICHAPATTPEECEALRLFIEELSIAKTGTPPRALPADSRRDAEPPRDPPAVLIDNAHKLGIALSQTEWEQLDDDERYALVKLGGTARPSHNLRAALEELLTAARASRVHAHRREAV